MHQQQREGRHSNRSLFLHMGAWIAWSSHLLMVGFLLTRYTLAWVFLVFGAICVVGGGITALFATETRERLLEEVSP